MWKILEIAVGPEDGKKSFGEVDFSMLRDKIQDVADALTERGVLEQRFSPKDC